MPLRCQRFLKQPPAGSNEGGRRVEVELKASYTSSVRPRALVPAGSNDWGRRVEVEPDAVAQVRAPAVCVERLLLLRVAQPRARVALGRREGVWLRHNGAASSGKGSGNLLGIIRQHTSAYVSIRQLTAAHVSIR